MNNKHLSWYKEINNNFIIASRAYFLQSLTCTRVNNLDYTVMILTPMEPWCWSCFARGRGLVNGLRHSDPYVLCKYLCLHLEYPHRQACIPRQGKSHPDTGRSLESCIFIVRESGWRYSPATRTPSNPGLPHIPIGFLYEVLYAHNASSSFLGEFFLDLLTVF